MMGTVAFGVGFALVIVAAAVPAASVARGRIAPFVVVLWTIGLAELVVVSIGLSAIDSLTRPMLLASLGLVAVGSLATGRARRVTLPSHRRAAEVLREITSDRMLLALVVGAVVALGYSAILSVFTAPTEHDALTYHLIRAALWKQQHGIGWIDGPVDVRANASPVVAEVGVAGTMILQSGDRFVALPQLTALIACVFGVFSLARTVGFDRRASAFAGLSVSFLPVVLVQSSTAMNDLVPAGCCVAAALFALGGSRRDVVVAGLALALLVGTKGSAFLVVPALALLVVLGQPPRRWPGLAVVGAVGAVLGSVWYAVTRQHEGDPTAGLAGSLRSDDPTDLLTAVARFSRYLGSSLEVPGVGLDQLLYVVIGLVLLVIGVASRRRSMWIAGLLVAALPLVVFARGGFEEAYKRTWWKLGRPDLARLDVGDRNGTLVSAGYSWYGPIAVGLSLAALVLIAREVRTGRIRRAAVALALAPLLTIATLAVTLTWSPVFGRLVMPGVMLGAATWGVVYRARWAALGATAGSLVVAFTSFWWFDKKQVGIRLVEPARQESVWRASRSELQDYEDAKDGLSGFVDYVDRIVPQRANVAVIAHGPAPYVFLGASLRRRVQLVDLDREPIGAGWWIGRRGERPPCRGDWAVVDGNPRGEYWLLHHGAGPCR